MSPEQRQKHNAHTEAMSVAETNRPIGRGYNTVMSGLLEAYGVDDMSETARAHILKVMENFAAVEEWRTNQPDPDDLNHPSRVWQRTQQERAQRRAERKALTDQELEACAGADPLEAEIEHLKVYIQELEAALTRMREAQAPEQPKRRRGRPPGSKNKPKPVVAAPKKGRGRPPGSKNKPKPAAIAAAI